MASSSCAPAIGFAAHLLTKLTSRTSERNLRLMRLPSSSSCIKFKVEKETLCLSIGRKRGSADSFTRRSTISSTEVATNGGHDVLVALSTIIDPDFGADIVTCGFVKDLQADKSSGEVAFRLELTTPACPVKDMFEQQAKEKVAALPWVTNVKVTMSAQPAKALAAEGLPRSLQNVSNIIAVSSCKGGVGKSTVAVNLAYSLAGMGAKVGIFDADVYGPSLPTMVSPELRVLQMVEDTKQIIPTEYLGVKLVSFGFAGQGTAIMRGPMVSGVINQLLTTTDWGELDYLIIDMPPGTGDIQLTLCQVVPLTAAVIVTTPQKLAFIDVAKGVRMFSKLKVPCLAVVENMCYFDADGKRYYPFGRGSGKQVVQQFGISNLFEFPIRPELSAAGDSGTPEVVHDPQGDVARSFSELGVCVVQQCAKIRQQVSTAVTYDEAMRAIKVKVPGTEEPFYLHPATVRRNDRSAKSIDEWTGEQKLRYGDVREDIEPEAIQPLGNYAVMISWPDGFNQVTIYMKRKLAQVLNIVTQVAPYDQLEALERLVDTPPGGALSSAGNETAASAILKHAKALKEAGAAKM
ncbi:fe-S cluster assembly factor HCF101, chloroplastic isoform X1 [Selaginella moellendorffii]|uniref:fe-S cluster assembly factor HCF101, chloroplastic isoform X1 n=1 Tax=Selaginella moellendorffii TaxID=88036 RepID=UPI000D1C8B7D|nr:fe-S cluster assembly factor HCF101, chloroplastic isoform X1 [Selaginella moellendorffii]|eukprot:XP_024529625.1 fe-S cluster assembly factor HCF101, chloroplastic isoform X1 [Selaginella moellendorffii]